MWGSWSGYDRLHYRGRLRPDVIWFRENLQQGTWKTALARVRACDVLVSVGTSGIVTPAADIPGIAIAAAAIVIHVNLVDVTMGTDNEIMLIGKAAAVLAKLID